MSVLSIENTHISMGRFSLKVSLELNEKVTGIFGPSGAGKTTLLEMIAGLKKPESGKIQLKDQVLVDRTNRVWEPPEQRRIGYVPQDLALFPHMTIRKNLLYCAGEAGQFEHIVAEFQLQDLLARYPASLSGGEKQRVAIGRALMMEPKLLMLDEPLTNLDQELKERGMELFRRVRDYFATPILYVTHDADEIVKLCDEVVVLNSGRVERRGEPTDVFQRSPNPTYIYSRAGRAD